MTQWLLYAVDMRLAHLHMDSAENYGESSYAEASENAGTAIWLLDMRALAEGTFHQPRAVTLGNHLRP